jgi:hypothetical protein
MDRIDTFAADSLVCATSYVLDGANLDTRFGDLVACGEEAGLSPTCARLFAHLGAATVAGCQEECSSSSSAQGEPPACERSDCAACATALTRDFDDLAGRNLPNSGISDSTARPCSSFTRVVHDPCVGSVDGNNSTTGGGGGAGNDGGTPPTTGDVPAAPTGAPSSGKEDHRTGLSSLRCCVLVAIGTALASSF